jgi:hypothetical protein
LPSFDPTAPVSSRDPAGYFRTNSCTTEATASAVFGLSI